MSTRAHFSSKSPDHVERELDFLDSRISYIEYTDIIDALSPAVMTDRLINVSEHIDKEYIKPLNNFIAKSYTAPIENLTPSVHTLNWDGLSTLTFGLISDTHLNCKHTQLTYLNKFYDICAERGVQDIYLAGDLDDGEKMRKGHEYELYTHGADDHVDEIVRVFPKKDGVNTHFITGNHDAALFKAIGFNLGKAVADKRPDMKFLGCDTSIIKLTPNCTLQLSHPWDGTAYAISYKIQKRVGSLQGGEKPNILAVGHYHKLEYIFIRNVHCFQTGTYCAQTPFMVGKSIEANMGGWIVTVKVDENGYIREIIPTLFPEYYAIKDDWKNWR